jgi:MFS family permease
MDRAFRRYAAIQSISILFNNMHVLLLPYWYYELTGSKLHSTAIFAVEGIFALVAVPFVGVLVDNLSHRKLTVIAEAARGASVACLLAVSGATPVVVILILAAINSVASSVFFPLQQAVMKNNVGHEGVLEAQSLFSAVQGATLILGPASGAWLAGVVGYKAVFALNAASFLLSAASHVYIRDPQPRGGRVSFHRDIRDAASYLSNRPALRMVYFVQFATYVAVGSLGILFIYFFRLRSIGLNGISMMMAAQGAGVLLGSRLAARSPLRADKHAPWTSGGMGLVLCVLAAVPSLGRPLIGLLIFVFGFLFVNLGVATRALVQESAEVHMIGRLSSLLRLTMLGGSMLSTLAVVLLSERVEADVQLLLLGLLLALASLAILVGRRRSQVVT